MRTDGRMDRRKDVMTDMAKLIVLFRNFVNQPKTHTLDTMYTKYNERGHSGLSVISDKEPTCVLKQSNQFRGKSFS